MNSLGAYGYLLWGNLFDIPYKESIMSLLPAVDEFVIVTDPRFKDGTIEHLREMALKSDKIKLIIADIDLNNPGVDGATKTLARKHSKSNLLLQVDFDEVFREEDLPKIEAQRDNPTLWKDNIIGAGVINWFGGEYFKMSSAGWIKERFSVNRPGIVHGIPIEHRIRREQGLPGYIAKENTDGAGYINEPTGKSIVAREFLCDVNNFPHDCFNPKHIWIHHYSWYSIIRKWRMKPLWHYFWGILYGKYVNLDNYTIDIDGDPVNFWDPEASWKPLLSYIPGIVDEMKERSIKKNKHIEHPPIMEEWVDRQPVFIPRRGFRKELRRNM